MADQHYIDRYITSGQKETLSLKNFYDTILVENQFRPDHIYRIPIDDFFLKYRAQLEPALQWYSLPESFYYKPKLLSMEQYGTTELWLAILRANGMKNITEFHYPVIKLYNSTLLKELISTFFKREGKF